MKGNFQQHFKQVDAVVCCMFQFISPSKKGELDFMCKQRTAAMCVYDTCAAIVLPNLAVECFFFGSCI